MIKPFIISLGCLISAYPHPQSVGVYTEMSTHRVCCCNNIGILTDATNFNGSVTAPCKTDFEKMYDGKANVIRVDSIEALNSCSVVFFGIVRLQGASTQAPSLYPSYDNWLGTGSASTLNAKLYEYVKNGGKVVAIGDTSSRTTPTAVSPLPQASADIMNSTLTACRNGVSSGLTILPDISEANQTSCTQGSLGCSCGGAPIARYWVGQISVPSGDADGAIFKSSEDASQHWISVFGVGHSSGGVALTANVNAVNQSLSTNTCSVTSASLRPFAYEKVDKGYIMYLGDRNMFAWQRSLETTGSSPNLTPCGAANVFPTNINCFTGPVAEYTGLNVYEANKFFLWSLLKACSSC